jgi:phosphoribosylanthranilate isomerase
MNCLVMFESGNRVAIKICGLTRPENALACADAGVHMLGLNFSPRSPRCIAPSAAEEIVTVVRAQFPLVRLVGIFVDQERSFVEEITNGLGLDAVQLHGVESPDYANALAGFFVIKAFRVGDSFSPDDAAAFPCGAILLDSWNAKLAGGTGESFPWSVAATLRPLVKNLILAGGLMSANVAEAIRVVRPNAVDVCSGVESAPGRKDIAAVRAFVRAVR